MQIYQKIELHNLFQLRTLYSAWNCQRKLSTGKATQRGVQNNATSIVPFSREYSTRIQMSRSYSTVDLKLTRSRHVGRCCVHKPAAQGAQHCQSYHQNRCLIWRPLDDPGSGYSRSHLCQRLAMHATPALGVTTAVTAWAHRQHTNLPQHPNASVPDHCLCGSVELVQWMPASTCIGAAPAGLWLAARQNGQPPATIFVPQPIVIGALPASHAGRQWLLYFGLRPPSHQSLFLPPHLEGPSQAPLG